MLGLGLHVPDAQVWLLLEHALELVLQSCFLLSLNLLHLIIFLLLSLCILLFLQTHWLEVVSKVKRVLLDLIGTLNEFFLWRICHQTTLLKIYRFLWGRYILVAVLPVVIRNLLLELRCAFGLRRYLLGFLLVQSLGICTVLPLIICFILYRRTSVYRPLSFFMIYFLSFQIHIFFFSIWSLMEISDDIDIYFCVRIIFFLIWRPTSKSWSISILHSIISAIDLMPLIWTTWMMNILRI